MSRPKKCLEEIPDETASKKDRGKEIQHFIKLVNIVKSNKDTTKVDSAFNEIIGLMQNKIMHISYTMKIPGFRTEDLYQEALFALRYKAIKDYDQTKSLKSDVSPFDNFAILCIRRHLSTKLKASYQSKQRVLNRSVSLDQDRSQNDSLEESSSLSNFLPNLGIDTSAKIRDKEEFKHLVKKLIGKISKLEYKVLKLYSRGMSYDEMTREINKHVRKDNRIRKKSIDNALSRIKIKAKEIYNQYQDENF